MKVVDLPALKEFLNGLKSLLDKKVDKVTGKGLSTNDFTNSHRSKLEGIEDGANKTEIVNNLISSNKDKALSANMGKYLYDNVRDMNKFLMIKDTRREDYTPAEYRTNYSSEVVYEFKYSKVLGVETSTNYGILQTINPWKDKSGGKVLQYFHVFNQDTFEVEIYRRSGNQDEKSWSSWESSLMSSSDKKKIANMVDITITTVYQPKSSM